MAVEHGYIPLAKLKVAMRDSSSTYDEVYERAIESASRLIDEWTGRFFYRADAPVVQRYRATSRTLVVVQDFPDTTGMTVATDDDGDGVFETPWSASEWQAEPFNLINGWPYTMITTTTRNREFPLTGRRPGVQVTNTPGWVTHTRPIEQACQLMAGLLFRGRDLTGADLGVGEDQGPLSKDPLKIAKELLAPYAMDGSPLKPKEAAA